MRRVVDLRCVCGYEEINAFLDENDKLSCKECGKPLEQVWWARPHQSAQWSDADSVVVYIDPKTKKLRYPGRNDRPTPAGYERIQMKSLREVESFEKSHGVLNEAMHYDRNGRGFDDNINGQKETH